MEWEVGRSLGAGRWRALGRFEAPTPRGALEVWRQREASGEPGVYGVRLPGPERWRHCYRMDPDGSIHGVRC